MAFANKDGDDYELASDLEELPPRISVSDRRRRVAMRRSMTERRSRLDFHRLRHRAQLFDSPAERILRSAAHHPAW